MLAILALLVACNTDTVEPTVTPPPGDPVAVVPPPDKKIPAILARTEPVETLPAGEAIVRQCWGQPEAEARMGSKGTGPGGGGYGAGGTTPSPKKSPPSAARPTTAKPTTATAAAPPSPAPAPPADAGASAPSGGAPAGLTGASSAHVNDPKPAAAPPAAEPAPSRPDPIVAKEKSETKRVGADKDANDGARASQDPASVADTTTTPRPTLDWGATVYLSNDDSMSLASAQHLLHAVKNDDGFSAGEIRPHELLNYFSFDTQQVSDDELFSVLGGGEKIDSDTLTLAFAVKGAQPPRRPLDLTLVIDRSGSMSAEGRMEYVKRALHLAESQLQRGDRVDVVLFDDEACTPLENYVVGRDDASLLTQAIDDLRPKGGTDISIGMREAYRIVDQQDREAGITRNRRMMLLTDALANQGNIDADVLASAAQHFEEKGIRITGVGVGVGFNDAILDEITDRSSGGYVYLGSEAVVDRLFGPGFPSLVTTIAHDVRFEIDLPESLAMEKFYGEEASTVAEDVDPIDYYAGTTQLFLQDLTVDPDKLKPEDAVKFTIRYRDESTGEPGEQTYSYTVAELMGNDRHNLDKARALMAWTDMLTDKALGGNACGKSLDAYAERAGKLSDDAEIAYVNSLVQKWCPLNLPTTAKPASTVATVAYKVKVDADIPIAEVGLDCGSASLKDGISGSDTVARFDAPAGKSCTLTLYGTMPMTASVTVPSTGGDVRCTVRGGRMNCG